MISLFGSCPDCGVNLDDGGNPLCVTCAAEPVLVTATKFDRDLVVVVISPWVPITPDIGVEAYLRARFPHHIPILDEQTGNWLVPTGSGEHVVLLDLNIGG